MEQKITRRNVTSTAISLATLAAVFPTQIYAQKAYVAGKDYAQLQAVQLSGLNKPSEIEVVEFFMYSCPHCRAFQPLMQSWEKRQKNDVFLTKNPVAFHPRAIPHQKLYFALQELKLASKSNADKEKLSQAHAAVFTAIHDKKMGLQTVEEIAQWANNQELNTKELIAAFNSFTVNSKIQRANRLAEGYKIEGVPALGVAGRYLTDGSMAQGMPRALEVVDYLVALQRKK